MAARSDTTGGLARTRKLRTRSDGLSGSPRLVEVAGFGANPGQLRMFLHAPADLPAQRPLVVVMHGCTQTADGYAQGAGWLTLADRFKFAVVCPQQQSSNNPNLCFNWFETSDIRRGAGEIASIRNMVETAAQRLQSDRTRIFVTGLSAGGAMASALLAAYPDVFAGGGIVAGLPYGVARGMSQAFIAMFQDTNISGAELGEKVRLASAHEGPWPRVSVWHGAADTTVRPLNADAVIAQWADVHGLGAAPSRSERIGGRTRDVWMRNGEVMLERQVIAGLGHGTPLETRSAEGVGKPGPFLLEAGVSSSLELLKFWKIARSAEDMVSPGRPETVAFETLPAVSTSRAKEEGPPPHPDNDPTREKNVSGIGAVIQKALQAAGLM